MHIETPLALNIICFIRDIGGIVHTVTKDKTTTNVQKSHDWAFFVG